MRMAGSLIACALLCACATVTELEGTLATNLNPYTLDRDPIAGFRVRTYLCRPEKTGIDIKGFAEYLHLSSLRSTHEWAVTDNVGFGARARINRCAD